MIWPESFESDSIIGMLVCFRIHKMNVSVSEQFRKCNVPPYEHAVSTTTINPIQEAGIDIIGNVVFEFGIGNGGGLLQLKEYYFSVIQMDLTGIQMV